MSTNIDAIRRLLAEDIARAKLADQDAAAVRDKLNDDHDPERSAWRINQLRNHQARASEARQSFSARTEMLQYIDLGDLAADELVASAVGAPGGEPAAHGTTVTPTVSAERTIDQDVRDFLTAHNHR